MPNDSTIDTTTVMYSKSVIVPVLHSGHGLQRHTGLTGEALNDLRASVWQKSRICRRARVGPLQGPMLDGERSRGEP